MTRGRNFRDQEYWRRTWVRFPGQQPPERLNTKMIDALKQLEGAAVAAAVGPAGNRTQQFSSQNARRSSPDIQPIFQ